MGDVGALVDEHVVGEGIEAEGALALASMAVATGESEAEWEARYSVSGPVDQ